MDLPLYLGSEHSQIRPLTIHPVKLITDIVAKPEHGSVGPEPKPEPKHGDESSALHTERDKASRRPAQRSAPSRRKHQAIRRGSQTRQRQDREQGAISFNPDGNAPQGKVKQTPAIRTETGQFAKGQSGNPSGRPKGAAEFSHRIREFLFANSGANLQTLVEKLYLEDPKTLLAYGFGKPIEIHEVHQTDTSFDPELVELGRQMLRDAWAANN